MYPGSLYETQTLPSESCATRIFIGRSMAILGVATIQGVPAFELPKIKSLVGAHLKTRPFGLSAVIDRSKEFDILCGECFFNPLHHLVYRVVARYRDDT